jgi:DNA repair protein RecO (recombination protein O)
MPDYSTTIIVLKKTRLAETDLIITGFSDEGRQTRAVAKGARRPGSKLGVHLELYSVARVLLHKGRTLDIVTEAALLCGNEACRADVVHSAGAAVIVELLDKVSMDGDSEPRLFPLSREALRCVGAVPEEGIALIAAATILKVAAQLGFRPSLRECVLCGMPPDASPDASPGRGGHGGLTTEGEPEAEGGEEGKNVSRKLAFSFDQGGVICATCLSEITAEAYRPLDASLIGWAELLITSRFIDLEPYATPAHEPLGVALLIFAREWLRSHLIGRLKSLDFLLNLG